MQKGLEKTCVFLMENLNLYKFYNYFTILYNYTIINITSLVYLKILGDFMFKKIVTLTLIMAVSLFAINVKTATKDELMSIKGIGEVKAATIIKYRKTHKVKTAEDLKDAPGIGPEIVSNLKKDVKNKTKSTSKKSTTKSKSSKKSTTKSTSSKKSKDSKKDSKRATKLKESKAKAKDSKKKEKSSKKTSKSKAKDAKKKAKSKAKAKAKAKAKK